jgi:lipoprotein-releasing system permease protein
MAFSQLPVVFIGLRYLLSRKDNRLFSFTSVVAMAGLTLGVTALVLVLSIFNGSQGIQRERTLITVPHGDIHAVPGIVDWQQASLLLEQLEDIQAVAPYLPVEALLSRQGTHQVAQVRGIIPDLEARVSPLEQSMIVGSLQDLQAGGHGIVIGRNLANNLRLYPGDAINLIVPRSNASGTSVQPEMHRFTVRGVFDVQFDIGGDLAYVHLEDSLLLAGEAGAIRDLHLRLLTSDIHAAGAITNQAVNLLNEEPGAAVYAGEDWSITQASLFNALKLEKIMTWFMLMMIVAIGAFNIISTLVMAVAEKQADIAILRTMGAGERTIMGIFLVQGSLIGVAGVLLGACTGILLVQNFSLVSGSLQTLLSPDTLYLINELPAVLQTSDVVITCTMALLISFLATLYPAIKAARIKPAQVLRYE